MYTGGAGGYSFYVRDGEQVVRQRKNNSNYGSTASRSYAQMIRRIRWGNLVNVFKAIKSWQQKAYDAKKYGQTDYNIFMQLNINKVSVGTTKEMNEGGAGIVEAYQVSRGSIPPIGYSVNTTSHLWITDIAILNDITFQTTIGELSTDIIDNNPTFQEGDNIAFIFMKNWMDSRVEWPFVQSKYAEITLNKSNTALVSDIPVIGERLSQSSNNTIQLLYTEPGQYVVGSEVGFAAIHTRKSSGNLQVSSQSILMNTQTIIQNFSGSEWDDTCIQTYGLDTEVPLDPNFKPGTIVRVTANGAVVSNAETLIGQQAVRVYGDSLVSGSYRFVCNGIEYTPLSQGDDYDEYLLTANGSVTIWVDGRVYMSFNVTGISMPSDMSGVVRAFMRDANHQRIDDTTIIARNGCVNMARVVSAEAPSFGCYVSAVDEQELEPSLLTSHNGTLSGVSWVSAQSYLVFDVVPVDDSQPLWVDYDGFIVFVANYSN